MTDTTRRALLGAGLSVPISSATLAAPATTGRAAVEWRMVTSWPANLPGPGVTAARLAERITALTDGAIRVKLYAAGELTGALSVFDAVADGTAQLGHTASLFWAGKTPLAPLYTAAPFGLTPLQHMTWIEHGGGQALWDELYAPFGLKPFMGGNTGSQMGGWFRDPVRSLDDLAGLKIRMPGLGGAVISQLGATTVAVAPGEILPSLQSGVIDAAEFLGPWSDTALGLADVAPYYAWPGFHEPNGSSECLVALGAWDGLGARLQEAVRAACTAENAFSLAESEWNNALALDRLSAGGVTLFRYPDDVLAAAATAAETVYDDLAAGSDIGARTVASYRGARETLGSWGRVTTTALRATPAS